MQARQLGRWIVTSASVVVPLAVVLYTLQYQSVLWSLVALAGAAATAVSLAELSARIELAGVRPQPVEQAVRPEGQVAQLHRRRPTT